MWLQGGEAVAAGQFSSPRSDVRLVSASLWAPDIMGIARLCPEQELLEPAGISPRGLRGRGTTSQAFLLTALLVQDCCDLLSVLMLPAT